MTGATLVDRPMATAALRAVRRDVLVAVVRAHDLESARRGVDALVAGGITGIELTYTTPDATAVIARLHEDHGDAITLGAGTVLTGLQAREAVDAGATFLVSPGTRPELAEAMRATGAAVLLGALTPSEVMAAVDAGADLVKLFPANLGGPAHLRSLRGPFPDVPFCPTGGVNPDTIPQWIAAGAEALGAGGELCSGALMQAADWAQITANARAFAAALPR